MANEDRDGLLGKIFHRSESAIDRRERLRRVDENRGGVRGGARATVDDDVRPAIDQAMATVVGEMAKKEDIELVRRRELPPFPRGKDINNMSVMELESGLEDMNLSDSLREDLRVEKQDRVNKFLADHPDFPATLERRIKERLRRDPPNYYRKDLDDLKRSVNWRFDGLSSELQDIPEVLAWGEIEAVILTEALEAEKSVDPRVANTALTTRQYQDRKARLDSARAVSLLSIDPRDDINLTPPNFADWERLYAGGLDNNDPIRNAARVWYAQGGVVMPGRVEWGGQPTVGTAEGAYGQIPVIQETARETTFFSEQFLRAHDLPEYVYVNRGTYRVKRDMRTMLFELYSGGTTEGLSLESFRDAMIEIERGRQRGGFDVQAVTRRATDSWNYFLYGTYKTMQLRINETNGTLRSWVGSEGGAGILGELKPNMKWIAGEFLKDPQAVRALRVWIALGGSAGEDYRKINGLVGQDKAIVDRHFKRFKELMVTKEYKKTRGGETMSRTLGAAEMEAVEIEMTRLGIDRGVVGLTREMAGLIAWNPETVDPRKQMADFDKYLEGDKRARLSLISRPMWDKGPSFIQGFERGGVEKLLENIVKWTHAPIMLTQAYDGMQKLMRSLVLIRDLDNGADELGGLTERQAAMNKAVDEIMMHKDFPPLDPETAQAWRRWPLYEGRGKHIKAREVATSNSDTWMREQMYFLKISLPRFLYKPIENLYEGFLERRRKFRR